MRRVIALAALLLGGALPAHAALDLGRIDEGKLKSFADYFKPYLAERDTEFKQPELREKVLAEAKNIHAWLSNEANWPAKVSAPMLASAGLLYSYFDNLDFEGAGPAAIRYLREAVEKDPANAEIRMAKAEYFARKGPSHALEAAIEAEKALELNEPAAAAAHGYYLAATSFYKAGFFRKATEYLKKQAELDPQYENTADLGFVFESLIGKWKQVPERITFKPNENGDPVPAPL